MYLPLVFQGFQKSSSTTTKPHNISLQDILPSTVDGLDQLTDADIDQWTDKMAASLIKAYRARQSARHSAPNLPSDFQVIVKVISVHSPLSLLFLFCLSL